MGVVGLNQRQLVVKFKGSQSHHPRHARVLVRIGVFVLLVGVLSGLVLRFDMSEETPTGRVFVIPSGASDSVEIPTIDSAIEIPTEIIFGADEVAAITIYNNDDVAHRAGPWVIGARQSYTASFDNPGTYRFNCTIDPTESVVVIVEEPQ